MLAKSKTSEVSRSPKPRAGKSAGSGRKRQIRGWEEKFKDAADRNEPVLLLRGSNEFDHEEWEW
jgi:hypothetical protein